MISRLGLADMASPDHRSRNVTRDSRLSGPSSGEIRRSQSHLVVSCSFMNTPDSVDAISITCC